MHKFRLSLLNKIIISLCVVGVLMTIAFVKIEGKLFMDTLHMQQKNEWETNTCHAADCADWIILKAKNAVRECSNLEGLRSGNKRKIEHELMHFLEQDMELFRRAYYVDSIGNTFSSHQVDLEVIQITMDYDIPRRIAKNTPKANAIAMSDVYRSSMITKNTIALSRRVPTPMCEDGGTVVLELDLETIGKLVKNTFGFSKCEILLVTKENSCAYSHLESQISEELLSKISQVSEGWTPLLGENGVHLRTYRLNGNGACSLDTIIILKEDDMYRALKKLFRNNILISTVLFIDVILFLSVIVGYYVRPIRDLSKNMNEIGENQNQLISYKPLNRQDEIGDLSRNFSRMLIRIQQLIDLQKDIQKKQYEAEIKVLQYQLRPHFLYNTLNAISNMALQKREDEIPPAISALVHMLAMNTDKVDAFVTLEEELKYTEEFVRLMRLRYEDRFDLYIHVFSDLQKLIVPKLILQPIIENSVFHGFAHIEKRGLIVIEGTIKGDNLVLSILDNGNGIPEEKVKKLLCPPEESKSGLRSTGLLNTQSRIQLYFGKEYGLIIKSILQVGTRVEFIIPAIHDKNDSRRKWV